MFPKVLNIFYCFLFLLSFNSCLKKDLSEDNFSKKSKLRFKTIHGDIVISLFTSKAPATSKRIKYLTSTGFYNGLTFHRVEPGFVIQTGDPLGTGSGGSGKKLKAEFNDLKHVRGTVAMARYPHDIDSADSQFYISFDTYPQLDSKYTIFGKVIQGMDVAEKIVKGDKIITGTIE